MIALKSSAGPRVALAHQIHACQGPYSAASSCADCEEVAAVYPRLQANRATATVRVVCGQHWSLVVLRDQEGVWRWLGTVSGVNRYGDVKVEFVPLVKAPVEEIVIRNQELGAGTGQYVGALWILKVVDDRLRMVFSTGDATRMAWQTPDRPPSGSGDYAQSVDLLYGEGATGRPSRIRVITKYDLVTGKYRVVRTYNWSEQWNVFLPTPPDEVALLAEPN